jgi:hypothetical protein
MILESYVSTNKEAFLSKVKAVATALKVKADWLMMIMYIESRINPSAVNSVSNATGLIQFMPNTAISLGTTVAKLKAMSNVDQLEYVQKYYAPLVGRMNSFYDMYLSTFFPVAIGKPDDYVFQTKSLPASLIAKQNSALDTNNNGEITMKEWKDAVFNLVPTEYAKDVFEKYKFPVAGVVASIGTFLLIRRYRRKKKKKANK